MRFEIARFKKSPSIPLCQRGKVGFALMPASTKLIPPFEKGGLGGDLSK
jgi:hypothetical protein